MTFAPGNPPTLRVPKALRPWLGGVEELTPGMNLAAAVPLNAVFLRHSWRVHRHHSDMAARNAFTWSIVYLSLLFAALLVDHYFRF